MYLVYLHDVRFGNAFLINRFYYAQYCAL